MMYYRLDTSEKIIQILNENDLLNEMYHSQSSCDDNEEDEFIELDNSDKM